MSVHVCKKCNLTGDVKYQNGERKAYEAICSRDDCPQRPSKAFMELFERIPQHNRREGDI